MAVPDVESKGQEPKESERLGASPCTGTVQLLPHLEERQGGRYYPGREHKSHYGGEEHRIAEDELYEGGAYRRQDEGWDQDDEAKRPHSAPHQPVEHGSEQQQG